MYCTKCGAENKDGAAFCSACGTVFDAEGNAAQAMQAPEAAGRPAQPEQAAVTATQPAQPAGSPKKGKGKIIAIVLCVVAVVLCAVIVALVFFFPGQKDTTPRAITVSFSADGYDSSCTKIPVSITGTDSTGASIDDVGFIDESGKGIELSPGEYDLSFPASPLTPTGVLYNTPDSTAHVVISGKKDESAPITAFQDAPATFTKSSGVDETDEMINKAYEYAIMDESQAQKAEELKVIAENIHSQAMAAKNLATARLIDMPLYTVQIPEYWVGKVDVVKNGDTLTVSVKGSPKAVLLSVDVILIKDALNAGDIGNALFQHVNVNSTQRAEMWVRNWPYSAFSQLTSKYTSDSEISDSALNSCIDLQTGGKYDYAKVKSAVRANRSYEANNPMLTYIHSYYDSNVVLKSKDGTSATIGR